MNDQKPEPSNSTADAQTSLNVGLGMPDIYIDEVGSVIVVGHDAYRRASWIDVGRAIPDKWTKLVAMPNV